MARVVIQVNASRSEGNRYRANGGSAAACAQLATSLRGQFLVTAGPGGSVHDIDGGFLLPDRSELSIAMILTPRRGGNLTDADLYTISVCTFNAMKQIAAAGWSVNAMVGGLHQPTDSFNLSLGLLNPNGLSRIARTVDAGTSVGADTVGGHPLSDVRDAESGTVIPSTAHVAANNAIDAAKTTFETYKVPIYVGAGIVGLVAIAYVVRSFK